MRYLAPEIDIWITPHEFPAAPHRAGDGAPQLQPDRGGELALHLAIGGQQAHQGSRRRTRRRAVRAPRQAPARTDRPRQGDDRASSSACWSTPPASRSSASNSPIASRASSSSPPPTPRPATCCRTWWRHSGRRSRRSISRCIRAARREIAAMVSGGDADIGICTETLREVACADDLPVLQLASRRGRPQGTRTGESRQADAGGDRRMADHHLPRGLHRPRQHRPHLCRSGPRARHRHVGDGYRRAQGLRRAGPGRRHHRRHGLRSEAGQRTETDRCRASVRGQHRR